MLEPTDISRLSDRVSAVETTTRAHSAHFVQLDQAVADLRALLARVATRSDIDALRGDLAQAATQTAIAKVVAWLTVGFAVGAAVALIADIVTHA